MTLSLKLWQTDAFLSHVAILSTMFPFEGSLNCILQNTVRRQEFFEERDKSPLPRVSQESSRSTSGGPVASPPPSPLRFAAYRAAFFEVDELAKSDLPRSWQPPHRISSSPARIGQSLCAIWPEKPCPPPFMGAHRKGLIFVVPSR